MTRLEKILYLADYIEPSREFPGVDELRRLAYQDLDAAMILGLEMTLRELETYQTEPHPNTVETLRWLREVPQ